ncbi:MAG: 2OG-Fe(II) oxygenase [Planctomycetes bacterium]|nr:2OG-Fe(II) oxygenase [Planctomycetota bacterium]
MLSLSKRSDALLEAHPLANVGTLADGIAHVLGGETLVARVGNYYTSEVATSFAERILGHRELDRYAKAPDIGKIGSAFYDTVGDPIAESRYWDEAHHWIAEIRSAFAPQLSPIDRIRLDLDETWPGGASLLRDRAGRAAFVGLARVFYGKGADPHVDRLEWDAPAGRFDPNVKAQLAINVYLQVPPVGGELAIWGSKPDEETYEAIRIPGSYGVRREALSVPDVIVQPNIGDVLIFDANNIHSVADSIGGPRVTAALFVVRFEASERLFYYQ